MPPPPAILVSLTQTHFRARNDDGTESTATSSAALDTNFSQKVDTNFRLRISTLSGSSGSGIHTNTDHKKFQYNKNSAGWNDITSASSVIRLFTSTHVTDETATTQQITSGAFLAGDVLTSSTSTSASCGISSNSEDECCIQIRGVDVNNSDTIQVRMIDATSGSVYDTYSVTPTITVIKTSPSGFFVFM